MKSNISTYRPVLVLAPGLLAGAEKVVLTGLNALYAEGSNPLMVIIRETRVARYAHDFQSAIPNHIQSIIIDSTMALDIYLPQRLIKILNELEIPVVLHSHGLKALFACALAKGKYPHLHTHHGNTGHTIKVRVYEKLASFVMKSCNQVIAVSHKMKKELEKTLRPYKKITTIENMLSLVNSSQIREKRISHISAHSPVIKLIFVGRLSPEKGLIPFLECFSKFHSKDKFHLSILGDGLQRSLVEEFIKENNLSDNVTLYGFVSDPSLFFVDADVLIMPSLREGLPMTLIEALASGLPVIANDVGAISSLVTHKHNGLLTKNSATQNWNEALEETLKNVHQWKMNALKDSSFLEKRFAPEFWAKRTTHIYQQLILEMK